MRIDTLRSDCVALAAAAIFAAACAAYRPPARTAPPEFVVQSSFDVVWSEVRTYFQSAKLPVTITSRDGGLISSGEFELTRVDSTQWLDCGIAKISLVDHRQSDSLSGTFQVTLRAAGDSTYVSVAISATASTVVLSGATSRTDRRSCVSNGRFERELGQRLKSMQLPIMLR